MNPMITLLALVATAKGLVSDEFALHTLLSHSRRVRQSITSSPEDHPLRALATMTGATTATSCSANSCTSTGAGSYAVHSLTYSTSTGIFTGSITTNTCPSHSGAFTYGGVKDNNVAVTASNMASCQTYSVPQTAYTPTSTAGKAIPLRSGIGLTISGELIYAAMDAGFTIGQACTATRGMCPAGSDVFFCNALFDLYCGTSSLKGSTSSTMHMFLADCGGHAGYHNHADLSCEYSTTASGHSTLVAIMLDGRGMYGMYEETGVKPTNLDSCNGHTGPVPATSVTTMQGTTTATTTYTYAAATSVYHYHVTSTAPYFLGCFGPVASMAAAKALYPAYCAPTKYCSCDQSTGYCNCNGNSVAGTATTTGAASGGTGYYYSECTALGYYSNYMLDCPVFSHCTATTSSNTGAATCTTNNQYVTTNTSCVPCFGNCAAYYLSTGATGSATSSATSSSTSSATKTATSSAAPGSASATASSTSSATATATSTSSSLPTGSSTSSGTATATFSAALIIPTGSATSSSSATATATSTSTLSASPTPSGTVTVSGTSSSTPSLEIITPTPSPTSTPSTTLSATPSSTPTPSTTLTATPSTTLTATPSPTGSPSTTLTATPTPSTTLATTPSTTLTATPSPTVTPSTTLTASPTPTVTPSPTGTPSSTLTVSATRSGTRTPSRSPTASLTPGVSPSSSPSVAATPSTSMTPWPSSTQTPTPSFSGTSSVTVGVTPSPTVSLTPSSSTITVTSVQVSVQFAGIPASTSTYILGLFLGIVQTWLGFDATTPSSYASYKDSAGAHAGWQFSFTTPSSSRQLAATQSSLDALVSSKLADGSLILAVQQAGVSSSLGFDSPTSLLNAATAVPATVVAPAVSPTPSATLTPSPTRTAVGVTSTSSSSSSSGNNNIAIGAGVGLGVGIPVVLAIIYYIRVHHAGPPGGKAASSNPPPHDASAVSIRQPNVGGV